MRWALRPLRSKFRPEFLNRLDDIVLFQRLQREQMTAIVDIQLKRLEALLEDRKITLELDDAAKAWLAERGYEPAYGARPLKRVIQRFLHPSVILSYIRFPCIAQLGGYQVALSYNKGLGQTSKFRCAFRKIGRCYKGPRIRG